METCKSPFDQKGSSGLCLEHNTVHISRSAMLLTIYWLSNLPLGIKWTTPANIWIVTSLRLFGVRQIWTWQEAVSCLWAPSIGSVTFTIIYKGGLLCWKSLGMNKQTSCAGILSTKSPSLDDSETSTQTQSLHNVFNLQEFRKMNWRTCYFQPRSFNSGARRLDSSWSVQTHSKKILTLWSSVTPHLFIF